MLGAEDPIDWSPCRIAIAGVTGAGKSTLARRIAKARDLPYRELDSLYHGPGWQPLSSFERDVQVLTAAPVWVVEWQYPAARPVIAARADTLIWLDLPIRVTLFRVFRRTVQRRIRREQLWNGNLEPPLLRAFVDRDHILRWALRTQRKLASRIPETILEHPNLRVVRLRTQHQVDHWIAALERVHAE